MKIVILLVFLALGVGFLIDAVRKRKGKDAAVKPGERLISANEAPPTETGRLRMAPILDALKKKQKEEKAVPQDGKNADISAPDHLPDPFNQE